MSDSVLVLGERLRAAREAKGLSAQKAADLLHLDAWVIEALESGDYARIGPTVYGKGHLKRYAGLLGLPPEIVAAYDSGGALPAATEPRVAPLSMRADRGSHRVQWMPLAGFCLVIALGLTGIVRREPWRSADGNRFAEVPAPSSMAPPEPPRAAETASGPAVELPAAPAPSKAGTPPTVTESESVVGTGRARLRLSFSADSWVDVHDASGRRLFAGNGRANSVKTIAGEAPMKVYLGYASGVQLEVNNHVVAIGSQFLAGDVARFQAGADGVLRRDLQHAATAIAPHPRG